MEPEKTLGAEDTTGSSDAADKLFEACKSLDVEAVLRLLPSVGLRVKNGDGRFPMGVIARSQHPEQEDTSTCPHVMLFQYIKKHYPAEYADNLTRKDDLGQIMSTHATLSDCPIFLDHLATKESCSFEEIGLHGYTPLIAASQEGLTNSIRYLLRNDRCRVDYKDECYGTTALLWAFYCLQVEAVEELLKDPRNPPLVSQRTSVDEDAIACCLTTWEDCSPEGSTCKHLKLLEIIRREYPADEFDRSLQWKSSSGGGPVLRCVSENCILLLQFLKDHGCPLDEANNDGESPLERAASYGNCNALRFLLENKCDVEHKTDRGQTPFLSACEGLEYEAAKELADAGADTTVIDSCENTALHLICSNMPSESQEENFSKLFLWLSDFNRCTVDYYEPMLEKMQPVNLSCHNIPLTMADSGALKSFLRMNEIGQLKYQLLPIFRNSDGLNILHVYVAKHSLKNLHAAFDETPFADCWKDLINEKVQQGCFKGYGCLHFACQTGNLENINYLLENYPDCMKLKERFVSDSPSPMDVLIKHRHENLLSQLQFVTFHQLIESVDNVQTALCLPSVEQAKTALLPLCTPELKTVVINPQTHRDEKYRSARSSSGSGFIYPAGVKLFLLALKEDSPEIFRNIIALGLWSYLGTQRAADDVNDYICQQILDSDSSDATIGDELPDSHRGFGDYLKWRPSDIKSICFDLSSPSLLGFAIKSGRIKIAKDLILLNQYHLVPTCLLAIEECQFLLDDGKALAECVEELRTFALNVALNAMDELDKSADANRLQLLHKYIGGRFYPGNCSDPDCFGPKFSSLDKRTEATPFALAIGCGSNEVVASDCIVRCSKTEWGEPTIGCDSVASPRVKYRVHSASFLIFVCLFTYYVIAIEDQTTWIDVVILLFTVSFAIQEAMQFLDSDDIWDYLTDGWNYLDIGGILLLLVAILWKLYEDAMRGSDHFSTSMKYFIIRMLLSVAHLIWGFRFISFLRSFELVGPTINIIKTLLKRDLLPFLILFLSMCLSFGIFFYNLLNPDMRVYSSGGMVGSKDNVILFSIMTRPLLTAFGNMDLSDISSCEGMSADWLRYNATAAAAASPAPACTHPVGTFHYRKYLLIPFLFLINLTMLNVLIAKFSMTVASQEDVAYMIWRRGDVDLLNDYVDAPSVPPPFTIFWVLYVIMRRLGKRFGWRIMCLPGVTGRTEDCCYQPLAGDDGCERHRSWWPAGRIEKMLGNGGKEADSFMTSDEERKFVQTFKEYLLYQACTFHGQRAKLTRARKDHGPAVEKLQIDIKNLSRSSS